MKKEESEISNKEAAKIIGLQVFDQFATKIHNSDQKKEGFEISNREVYGIVRLQISDLFARYKGL